MTTFNARELIPTVTAIRLDALRGRKVCKTDFAHGLYDRLVEKLEEMLVDLEIEVVTEKGLAAERGTPDGDGWYEIYHICTHFEHKWTEGGPVPLLDDIYEKVVIDDGSCEVGLDYTEVPASELEGLAEVLDAIHAKTRVRFVAARVAREGEALSLFMMEGGHSLPSLFIGELHAIRRSRFGTGFIGPAERRIWTRRLGAVVYLSLTCHCAPATPASRTARPLQFSAAAPSGHRQKIGSSACRRWRSRTAIPDPSRLRCGLLSSETERRH